MNGKNGVTRREFVKATGEAFVVGTVFAALPSIGAPGPTGTDLRTKAKKNLKLAIFSGVYAGLPLEEAAHRIKADGFMGVVCQYAFKDVRFDPFAPDWEAARKITECFERNGVKIVGLYGYYNVVDPDPDKRRRGEARMAFLIANWKRLGCPVISTETGTFNPNSEWQESPENATEKGYLECRAALEKLARAAEEAGAIISVEPYWKNVISSAEQAERLFREVKSPALKLVMDPCNYFRREDLPQMQPMLREIFRCVGDQTVLAHAKDVKAVGDGTELPASGLGALDYPCYLRLLAQLDRELWLALEHLTLDDVPRARDYVLGQFERI